MATIPLTNVADVIRPHGYFITKRQSAFMDNIFHFPMDI